LYYSASIGASYLKIGQLFTTYSPGEYSQTATSAETLRGNYTCWIWSDL